MTVERIDPNAPLFAKVTKHTAKCRLCGEPMLGIRDWNLRFYGDCCPSIEETDVYPKRTRLKIYPPK